MRPKLQKTMLETEKIVDFDNWERQVAPYLKKLFALFFIVQDNKIGIINVAKSPAFFLLKNGLPDDNKFKDYLEEVEELLPGVNSMIETTINKLEQIYGVETTDFVCGKYCLESFAKYLCSKLHKHNIDNKALRSSLITHFEIQTIDYVRKKLYTYITS